MSGDMTIICTEHLEIGLYLRVGLLGVALLDWADVDVVLTLCDDVKAKILNVLGELRL